MPLILKKWLAYLPILAASIWQTPASCMINLKSGSKIFLKKSLWSQLKKFNRTDIDYTDVDSYPALFQEQISNILTIIKNPVFCKISLYKVPHFTLAKQFDKSNLYVGHNATSNPIENVEGLETNINFITFDEQNQVISTQPITTNYLIENSNLKLDPITNVESLPPKIIGSLQDSPLLTSLYNFLDLISKAKSIIYIKYDKTGPDKKVVSTTTALDKLKSEADEATARLIEKVENTHKIIQEKGLLVDWDVFVGTFSSTHLFGQKTAALITHQGNNKITVVAKEEISEKFVSKLINVASKSDFN